MRAWEQRTEIPLLLLGVAFLAAYALPVVDTSLPRDARSVCTTISWTVWGAFALDFVVRLGLARERGRYALRHWYDVVMIALPLLRPLRLLRMLALLRILHRSRLGSLASRATAYVVGTGLLSMFVGAITVLDAEQDAPGANITSFGDALWWAATTVTTVGYGDYYPVTLVGRLVAVGLMLIGIASLGVITASIAAWLLGAAASERDDGDGDAPTG